jgi:hypothetical protein
LGGQRRKATGFAGGLLLGVNGCREFAAGQPIGAKTNGNQLILSVFNFGSFGNGFVCSATLIKQ